MERALDDWVYGGECLRAAEAGEDNEEAAIGRMIKVGHMSLAMRGKVLK